MRIVAGLQVFVGTEFGEGTDSWTDSGYPRIAKIWTRGTKVGDAEFVFEGEKKDVSISLYYDQEVDGNNYEIVEQSPSFFESVFYLRNGEGKLEKTRTPLDMEVAFYGDQAILKLRKDWGGFDGQATYKAGSLLSVHWEFVIHEDVAGKSGDVQVLFEPTPDTSLESWTHTKNFLLLTCLKDVTTVVKIWKYHGEGDRFVALGEAKDFSGSGHNEIGVSPIAHTETDDVFVTVSGFDTPSTMQFSSVSDAGIAAPTPLKNLPHMFNAEDLLVQQKFATSKDGTKVPYFVVRKSHAQLPAPTLLYGYGGFEVSLTPFYSAGFGVGWLEPGYVMVIANIRGGGEYGPTWHQAALKENRNKAYEDFIAIGEDLIEQGITTAPQLGIRGGSNGGLLMGNMFVMRPDLWGAVVCQVPLLDMKRYVSIICLYYRTKKMFSVFSTAFQGCGTHFHFGNSL